MYDPSTVRFLTKDPEEYFGNDPNLYRYAANDPVNNTDPTGRYIVIPKSQEKFWQNRFPQKFWYDDLGNGYVRGTCLACR